jgi:hypothetical protein
MNAIYHSKNMFPTHRQFFDMKIYYDLQYTRNNSGIYVFGGQQSSGEASNKLYMLKLGETTGEFTLQWSTVEPDGKQPKARYGHAA